MTYVPGMTLRLKATYTLLPEQVYVMQVKNGKVWLVDVPRTMPLPRYLAEKRVDELYEKVV